MYMGLFLIIKRLNQMRQIKFKRGNTVREREMKVHGVFLVAVFFYLAYTQLISGQPLKDCQTSCGNVTVEYPFGTSPGYYYADDPDFRLTCNETDQKLLLEYRTVNQIVGLVIGLVWFSI